MEKCFELPTTTRAGLEEALKLEWSSTARVLYLLSQTPHHGWRFQQDFEASSGQMPGGCNYDLNGLSKQETQIRIEP